MHTLFYFNIKNSWQEKKEGFDIVACRVKGKKQAQCKCLLNCFIIPIVSFVIL